MTQNDKDAKKLKPKTFSGSDSFGTKVFEPKYQYQTFNERYDKKLSVGYLSKF